MVRHVYDFKDGGRDLAGLLGGKGANLAEMPGWASAPPRPRSPSPPS